jgi:glyoxalase family protein
METVMAETRPPPPSDVVMQLAGNHQFYTRVLGMRLVKKTVNQDDVSAYHLFYADGLGTPGTDLTFFDWPAPQERRGTSSIVRTALRVSGAAALGYWHARVADAGLQHGDLSEQDGRLQFAFEDPEGQRLAIIDDGGAGPGHPWALSTVPLPFQIRGLGPITLSVPALEPSAAFATRVLGMRNGRSYADAGVDVHVFEMGNGGPAAELHMRTEPDLDPASQGAGAVHHVAFRVPDDAFASWVDRYNALGVRSSGAVDRFYFRSLYAREPAGILYEIATDGPGFAADEPQEALGERLSLPPFLEPRRTAIERGLKPL